MSDKKLKLIIAVSAFAIYCVIFFSVIGIKSHFNTNQNDPDLIVEEMPLEESDPVLVSAYHYHLCSRVRLSL